MSAILTCQTGLLSSGFLLCFRFVSIVEEILNCNLNSILRDIYTIYIQLDDFINC